MNNEIWKIEIILFVQFESQNMELNSGVCGILYLKLTGIDAMYESLIAVIVP
jgi:hypothetical protein